MASVSNAFDLLKQAGSIPVEGTSSKKKKRNKKGAAKPNDAPQAAPAPAAPVQSRPTAAMKLTVSEAKAELETFAAEWTGPQRTKLWREWSRQLQDPTTQVTYTAPGSSDAVPFSAVLLDSEALDISLEACASEQLSAADANALSSLLQAALGADVAIAGAVDELAAGVLRLSEAASSDAVEVGSARHAIRSTTRALRGLARALAAAPGGAGGRDPAARTRALDLKIDATVGVMQRAAQNNSSVREQARLSGDLLSMYSERVALASGGPSVPAGVRHEVAADAPRAVEAMRAVLSGGAAGGGGAKAAAAKSEAARLDREEADLVRQAADLQRQLDGVTKKLAAVRQQKQRVSRQGGGRGGAAAAQTLPMQLAGADALDAALQIAAQAMGGAAPAPTTDAPPVAPDALLAVVDKHMALRAQQLEEVRSSLTFCVERIPKAQAALETARRQGATELIQRQEQHVRDLERRLNTVVSNAKEVCKGAEKAFSALESAAGALGGAVQEAVPRCHATLRRVRQDAESITATATAALEGRLPAAAPAAKPAPAAGAAEAARVADLERQLAQLEARIEAEKTESTPQRAPRGKKGKGKGGAGAAPEANGGGAAAAAPAAAVAAPAEAPPAIEKAGSGVPVAPAPSMEPAPAPAKPAWGGWGASAGGSKPLPPSEGPSLAESAAMAQKGGRRK
ncbi:unnamed protein product [Pedinophyceae sp. YPF-701]|nr:unnamed protein product [Pedinophyceae sp. YPF-701]